jgi:hypothetical protein
MRQILRNNDEIRMTKLEGMTNATTCHPERSAAESKDPAALPTGIATGFLDYARNDSSAFPSFGLRAFFVIRYSPAAPKLGEGGCFVISSS